MIIVHSANKKGRPAINKAEKKTRKTVAVKKDNNPENHQKKHMALTKAYGRIRYNVQRCISHIKEAQKKSDELYEILKNISSLKKNKEAGEIYEIIQSIHKRSEKLEIKHQKRNLKIQLVEEIIEDLQKIVNLTNDLITSEVNQKSGDVEKKLREITERIDSISTNLLYIQGNNGSNEAIQKVMDLKEKKVKSQRAKNKVKLVQQKNTDTRSAKISAARTIEKLMPLYEKFKITLPEIFSEIKEMTMKQYREKEKLISELLLKNIEEIRKKIEEEMNNKNLREVELEELREQEREITISEDKVKRYHSRLENHPVRVILRREPKHPPQNPSMVPKNPRDIYSKSIRSDMIRTYSAQSKNVFKKLEESCETLQKNLSCESEQYKEIQEIKKNIASTKTIIRDKVKRKKSFREKLYYLEQIIKNIRDIIKKIQGMAEKKDKKEEAKLEIKLEIARELLLKMEKRFLKIIIITDEIEGCGPDLEIKKKLAEIDPTSKDREVEKGRDQLKELEDLEGEIFLEEDREELSLKSQASDEYIDESLNYNPIKLLKTHIDHDPMEQEEQSPIKIKTTGNLEISKKHKIGLEIDFSEASKSSDDNSDEDLYDHGPSKKVKKKNYVESNYIEEDEL
jgi:hypothetical protein